MSEALRHIPAPAPNPDIQQGRASHPETIVWVGASAGSGKTKVLTDRVLRLLLPDPDGRWPGTKPHRLLCITYTKAAAAEMQLRVQKSLSAWAIASEQDLAASLGRLTGVVPRPEMMAAARKLFADVLDCPGGLKIMTIHAFCQSILGRFPLEARVNPDFEVLDDQMAAQMFTTAIESTLLAAQLAQDGDLAVAFRRLSLLLSLEDLQSVIRVVLKKPELLDQVLADRPTLAQLETWLSAGLDVPAGSDVSLKGFVAATPFHALTHLCALATAGNKNLQGLASGLSLWLALSPADRDAQFDLYQTAFLTQKGEPRKWGKGSENSPEALTLIDQEMLRYEQWQDLSRKTRQAGATASLLLLAQAILAAYEAEKKRLDVLDYDDLIRKTEALLAGTAGAWVHYKLDGGIDHILMDEAQDTNRHQWAIMSKLCEEVFTGQGRDEQRPRSLFVVGDEKQSIYSFQGADPAAFAEMRAYFASRSAEAERPFDAVPLDISFRTSAPILQLVDTVFEDASLKEAVGLQPDDHLIHYPFRTGQAGLVELWPLKPKVTRPKPGGWSLPFDDPQEPAQGDSLARQIALEISGWLQKQERLEPQGRAITPGDILILVRTRSGLVHELVRQLKQFNIPVSGVDRLILGDQIAVQDLLALARFARLPEDNFSLACCLKSPFIGWDDDRLMALALGLDGAPGRLWQALQAAEDQAPARWLADVIERSRSASPFEFFDSALHRPCPAAPQGTGWRALTSRLGTEVIDPLEELLSLCLKLEDQGIRTLEDLLLWQQKTDVEIKREMEEAGSAVRIMTVHAAKGLEAPIVILPDTTAVPNRGKTDPFLWPQASGLPVPLWAPSGAMECAAFRAARDRTLDNQFAEYARLLYVALTRARDRLYIMGTATTRDGANERSWYTAVEQAFARMNGVEALNSGRLRVISSQSAAPENRTSESTKPESPPIPAWLMQPPQAEPAPLRSFAPSRAETSGPRAPGPVDAAHPYRFERGRITHKLFQLLPGLSEARQEEAARYYVERAGRMLPEDVRAQIIAETLSVLRDPVFAPVFGEGSLAEVPVTGVLKDERLINGQIDRLIIRDGTILIVDFKTNRPSPRSVADIPQVYIDQLCAYRDTLALIYPNYLISCALLWTDQPLLMPVPIS